jgi:hypothetical protein
MAKDKAYPGHKSALRITSKSVEGAFSPWRELDAGQYTVGGSLTNDIALSNCSTAELFQLTVEPAAFNRTAIFLIPLSEGLEINGTQLPVGDRVAIETATTLNASDYVFEFSAESRQNNSSGETISQGGLAFPRKPLPGLNGIGLLTGKELSNGWQSRSKGASRLLGVAGFLLFAGFTSLGMRAYFGTENSGGIISTGAQQVSSNNLASVLASIDLAQYLKIDEQSRRIKLSGALTEEQAARLQIALTPFGGAVETRIKFKPNANHGVAGVFLKPREFVIASDGRLVGQGGLMKTGWRVATISRDGVELTKDGQMLIVPMGDGNLTTGSIKTGSTPNNEIDNDAQSNSALGQMRGTLKAVD